MIRYFSGLVCVINTSLSGQPSLSLDLENRDETLWMQPAVRFSFYLGILKQYIMEELPSHQSDNTLNAVKYQLILNNTFILKNLPLILFLFHPQYSRTTLLQFTPISQQDIFPQVSKHHPKSFRMTLDIAVKTFNMTQGQESLTSWLFLLQP